MRQPWIGDADSARPDDFSPRSATLPARQAAVVVALALLVLAAGRSGAILDAAYGLPVAPGTDSLIAAAEAWDAAMAGLGVPDAVGWLRGILGIGR